MNKLTESQIEQTVDEAFSKIMYNQEDIASQFANNYERYEDQRYEEALKDKDDIIKNNIPYLACIKTAQDNMLTTMKEILKELLLNS